MHNLGWDKKAQVLGRVFKTRPKPSFLKTRIYLSKTGPKTWAKAPFKKRGWAFAF